MFTVDAHLDLAYNALEFGRNLMRTVPDLRRDEAGQRLADGPATVTFPSLRQAGVGLVFSSVFVSPFDPKRPDKKLAYRDSEGAFRLGMQELDYYHRITDEVDYLQLVGDRSALEGLLATWNEGGEGHVGLVPTLEGADPIRRPEEVELWYERGVRVVGPAWDDTRYAGGAWSSGGGFTADGRLLMEIMADLGMILDIAHLSEEASYQALDRYEGPIAATHCNVRSLVPMERHLDDAQIRRLAERDGIMGMVLFNQFLKKGHGRTDPRQNVTLAEVIAHIDHVCQLLGDARHVGIGSDFDGGFGADQIPTGMDSVLDIGNIAGALRERGYEEEDVENIMGGNWLAFLRRAWRE